MTEQQRVDEFRFVGSRPVRPDGVDKVVGKAIYGPDFVAPGMIHGAILRSPHAHARIRGIDTRKAAALPGVKAIVTGQDFPQLADEQISLGEGAANIPDVLRNCMALEKVLYAGHAVAAVAATTRAKAEAALALIEVEYELLPHVTDLEGACCENAPILHEKQAAADSKRSSNISMEFRLEQGDADKALENAAFVSGGRYRTRPVHQGYIEPHACVASWNADNQGHIWCSSQGAFMVRALTASILNVPISDIRVSPLEIGGGFGGKTIIYLEPVCMLLSRKAGRPVRLAMSRQEVFRSSGPAPGCIVDIRLGADANGTLTGMCVEMLYDAGAFPGGGAQIGALVSVGLYRLPNYSVVGRDVVTNMPSVAAYRAPAAPQITFAIESCMDELARDIGMDPIELRLKNAVRPGDPSGLGTDFGEIGFVECLETAKQHPHWSAPLGEDQGRGVAAGYWFNGGGPSTASVSVAEDGSVAVVTGNPDIGGSRASMAIMAAETLGISYETVRVSIGDTASIGFSELTGGSRTTFATGRAVVEACRSVITTMKTRAAQIWGVEESEVLWRNGAAHYSGPGRAFEPMTMAQIATRANYSGGPIAAEISVNPHDSLPAYGVHICDVEVDRETGNVSIKRYTVVQDVGRAIHLDYVEGQMQGGAVQGIGWALNEAYVFDAEGRVDNPGFLDYRIPVASDLPMIDTVIVEKPNPAHPYGVKGVGEVPIVPPLAAVANAINAVTGKRMQHLPITPEKLYEALQFG